MATKVTNYIIRGILCLLTIDIVIGTMFADQHPCCFYNNFVCFPNIVYYGLAILFIYFLSKYINKISIRNRYAIALFTLLISTIIGLALWIPADIQSDYMKIHQLAIYFPKAINENKDLNSYFHIFPYNLHSGTLFSIIYYITHSWRICILTEGCFTLLSCVFTALTTNNITHNKRIAIITFIISTCLLGINLRSVTPYSDCSAMLCHTAAFYVYTTNAKPKLRFLITTILIAIGTYLKITSLIIIIAIIAYEFICNYKILKNNKTLTLCILYICTGLIILQGVTALTYKVNNFTPSPDKELRMSYFLYLGQNTNTHGTIANSSDYTYALSFTSVEKRDSALYRAALKRIAERGIIGNIKFYTNELIVSYRDGLLDHHERHLLPEDYDKKLHSTIGQILLSKGKFFQFYAGAMQIIWNTVLLLLLGSTILISNKYHFVTALIFIGSVGYILLFENRACYVYMFVPYITILAMLTLHKISVLKCSN